MARRSAKELEYVEKLRKSLDRTRIEENEAEHELAKIQRRLDMARAQRMALEALVTPEPARKPRKKSEKPDGNGKSEMIQTPRFRPFGGHT